MQDRLESLSSTLSNITLYDIKSMYNQAKNVVLNVSEMEAKVREATNDEAWGASSTLMQEIAQGTFNFQQFNEIMPCIYAQFMEKEARQWRQIYKALQLLEYLVKHGSERVVDDARSHVSTIKMLRSFHYIDDKGKDQGINVRNRSRELVELLSDVEKIRSERKKAKANRTKYVGTGNDGLSFASGGGRYGGFGSDTGGGGSFSNYGGSYGGSASSYDREYGAGGSGGGGSGGFRDETSRRGGFEEYDAGDYESPRRSTTTQPSTGTRTTPSRSSTAPTPAAKVPEPVKEVDLLGGFDDDTAVQPVATEKALPALASLSAADDGDDEFADFQAAPPSAKPNLMDLLGSSAPVAAPTQAPMAAQPALAPAPAMQPPPFFATSGILSPASQARPPSYASPPSAPNYTQPIMAASPPPRSNVTSPAVSTPSSTTTKSSGNFEDLWSMSLGSNKPTQVAAPAKSIKDLEKEKVQAGIWGAAKSTQPKPAAFGSGFGAFTSPAATSSSAPSGDDDLLL
ncbi:ENTH-domain-containing protein [Auriscalpium vulgare]|uniref:ENTH-domain-containing protein n=1 Tax=Auriscalpium vulgare TaxID=40419 RepID=A0ACB8S091_9AGAM|nr:ENTH-domain-containing protein [Auriscalpium vulgare]